MKTSWIKKEERREIGQREGKGQREKGTHILATQLQT